MSKIIIWGVVGVIVYFWLRKKLGLESNEEKTTIHHHHYQSDKNVKPKKGKDEDYIDYEELK